MIHDSKDSNQNQWFRRLDHILGYFRKKEDQNAFLFLQMLRVWTQED